MGAAAEFFPEKSRFMGQFQEAFPAEAVFVSLSNQLTCLFAEGDTIALAAGYVPLPAFECAAATGAILFLMFRLDIHFGSY